mgnify:CR=1 FL=1
MKVTTIREKPILEASHSGPEGILLKKIHVEDLKAAKVGKIFSAGGNLYGRKVKDVTFKVIYKDADGCALIQHEEGTTDSNEPEVYIADDMLVWIQYG